ncbi:MAG: ribosome assembly cofactor RimP [Treponema sp.]|nr:ribosome assembly cofactor RimP [Treponema sp.]
MKYIRQITKDPFGHLLTSLGPLVQSLGMSLIELNVFHSRGRQVQVKAVIYKAGVIGIDDCSKVSRSIMPRLELDFQGKDLHLEVSSTGIDRLIKEGREFHHYIGKEIRCFRTDISDWTTGILLSTDEEKIVLKGGAEEIALPYEIIAKARLHASPL